jgi:hypothetical protein
MTDRQKDAVTKKLWNWGEELEGRVEEKHPPEGGVTMPGIGGYHKTVRGGTMIRNLYTRIGRLGFQAFLTGFVGGFTALFGNESPGSYSLR